ncbi:MAG: double-strand break repair helicase AddA [Caedibacter sp. 38-128]|nr:double-strand break repair helicase AddA [Holosporales bacterium]OJX04011.1 MAG: double-strand break repair helicase AddA [Caedibacter sp. 38-128]
MATILTQASNPRHIALNPDFNVWVSASAGTGKTKILTDRLLTLLLTGVEPQKILCLTFTKAAAAEMKERLLQHTLEWATCSEGKLKESLHQFSGISPSQEQQAKARSLFMKIIDVTPGIRITTIHSFCQSLLAQFPVEAGITPAFKILAEHESQELLKQAVEEILAFSSTSQTLKQSIILLTERLHVSNFQEIIESLIERPERLQKVLREGLEVACHRLEEIFGCRHTDTLEDYLKQFCEAQKERLDSLKNASSCLMKGGKTDIARGEAIQALTALKGPLTARDFDSYASHFLTLEGEVRKNLASTAVYQNFPHVLELLATEAQILQEVLQRQKSLFSMKMTGALYILGSAILENYERLKNARHSLDYNDLIQKAKLLLTDAELSAWVLYKLDGGLDHILIDEAQDTNDAQWAIIQALTEEFYAGVGTRSTSRTLFAVGDPKQSIYSFQGTSPAIFEKKSVFYQQMIQAAQKNFYTLSLEKSFRSTSVILKAVNALCSYEEVKSSINMMSDQVRHISHHEHKGGMVELWPLVELEDIETTGREQLSICLAKKIKRLLDQKIYLEVQERIIEPSDILILLRERSSLMSSLISSLKTQGIPVAGPDRLSLLNEIAIQDLIALGEFLLLPEDDLNLACVLKSPLVDLDEEDLFNLAYNRQEETLWGRLQKNLKYQSQYIFLSELRDKVDFVGPFSLYSDLLNRLEGRKKFHARLGEECIDAIEEFLTLCLDYENTHCASLQEFLTWIKATDIEVKRDFSKANSGVRVMTVHGAKGLQAPVVILADTTTKPVWRDKFLWQEKPSPLLLWSSSHDELPHHLKKIKATLQAEQQAEYWRLLYVAMTRAEEHLYIAGIKSRAATKGAWYEVLSRALEPISQKIEFNDGVLKGQGLQLYQGSQKDPEIDLNHPVIKNSQSSSLPEYLQGPPAQEEYSEALISSMIEDNMLNQESAGVTLQEQILRRLLKELPLCVSGFYEEESQRIFKSYFSFVSKVLFEKCYNAALNIINHPILRFLFTAATYAEVPFVGHYKGKQVIGRIDRVVVQDQVVYVIVYKTDAVTSQSIGEISDEDRKKIDIYKRVIQNIFPGKGTRACLLWTETHQLIEI